ncbi:MAG: AAA family ATPase [Myxococcota bacterium]
MDPLIVSVLGPESSGKSTLTRALAQRFAARWVPETAREFYDRHPRPPEPPDILAIARAQAAALRSARGLTFFDTDPRSTAVWGVVLWGENTPSLSELVYPSPALTVLCRPDLPWVPDLQRVQPEQRDRDDFFRRLHARVHGPVCVVEGDNREERAAAAVQDLLQRSPSR